MLVQSCVNMELWQDVPYLFLYKMRVAVHKRDRILFSSPEPKAQGELLPLANVRRPSCVVRRPSSVVRRQQLL